MNSRHATTVASARHAACAAPASQPADGDHDPLPFDPKAAWRAGVQRVHDESGGLLDVDIIDAAAGVALLTAAALGDCGAAALLQSVTQAAARIKHAPRRKPALCMCCPRAIKRITSRTVFGIATPSIATPTGAIGFVFCDHCAADAATLPAKAAEGLRRIWPDLRPVVVTHSTGGRA